MLAKLLKYLPEEFFLLAVWVSHLWLARYLLHLPAVRERRWARFLALFVLGTSLLCITLAILAHLPRFAAMLPPDAWVYWAKAIGLGWGITSIGIGATLAVVRFFDRRLFAGRPFNPRRRMFLRAAEVVAVAAPLSVSSFGFLTSRKGLTLSEVDLPIPGLPRDLVGLRIAQLTDLHVSPFLSPRDLAAAVAMANEAKPHLTVVTGDLITRGGDPLDDCLKELARLRADAGVFGCLGNHEIYAGAEDYTTKTGAKLGLRFLRSETAALRFGAARLQLAGVDYQRMRGPYLIGTEALLRKEPGVLNVLLSHNPDVFPVAAAQGWDLTLSGHTHGGQMNVEILDQQINVARFYTPFVYGVYQEANSSIHVSRGIGTVGVPMRLGAPPEVSIIRLCAS